jgi:hypothetical protein
MNYIVILSQYGLQSIRDTVAKMTQSVTLIVKKTNGWYSATRDHPRLTPIREPNFNSNDIVVRWGNSMSLNGNFISYNSPRSTSIASNKGDFRGVMMDNEIPTPTPYHRDKNVWPVVVRPIHHHAGQHFHVANSHTEVQNFFRLYGGAAYASEVYPKQREVRVHCASGKVLLIKEKPAPDDINTIAWNFAINEEAWTTIDRQNYDPKICKLALDAMKAIGLDIGAVDIMFDPIDRSLPQYVICEINTAPSLTDYLSSKYAMYFDHIFSNSSKIPEWDYSKFKQGISFVWKNEQLTNRQS